MRITQVQVEEIKDQKYSRVGGMDEKYKILKMKWKGQKIRDTQGQMKGMEDQRYPRFSGNDKRSEILKVRWNG